MKSNLLRIFFEWALIASVLMSVGFFAWFYWQSHAARIYGSQSDAIQARLQGDRNFMALLQNDCNQYARTNAELTRFFQAPPPQPPAAAPAKPKSK